MDLSGPKWSKVGLRGSYEAKIDDKGRLKVPSQFRDLIVEAWQTSPKVTVGCPAVSLADVEAGRVDAYLALYSKD